MTPEQISRQATGDLEAASLAAQPSTTPEPEVELRRIEQERMRQGPRPFHNPTVRELLLRIQEQIIDESTPDRLLCAGPNPKSQAGARSLIRDFRQFTEDNKDEIEAISILHSRPHRAGLRYSQVKELARRRSITPFHIDEPQPQTMLRLWQAFDTVAPDKVDAGGAKHCKHIVDLTACGFPSLGVGS